MTIKSRNKVSADPDEAKRPRGVSEAKVAPVAARRDVSRKDITSKIGRKADIQALPWPRCYKLNLHFDIRLDKNVTSPTAS